MSVASTVFEPALVKKWMRFGLKSSISTVFVPSPVSPSVKRPTGSRLVSTALGTAWPCVEPAVRSMHAGAPGIATALLASATRSLLMTLCPMCVFLSK